MLIPVKIQCGCGQRYAFEVEPVEGYLPAPVACPICGSDGTSAANQIIAERLSAQNAAPVRVAVPASTTVANISPVERSTQSSAPGPPPVRVPGQLSRSQAEVEARAKIMWGDEPKEVVNFLRMQGYKTQEATEIVDGFFLERAAVIRSNGGKKVILGILLVCVPVVTAVVFLMMGIFPVKIFGLTLMLGCYGGWNIIKGAVMYLSPKSEPGDVADQ